MGLTLTSPSVAKKNETGGKANVNYGVSSMQGWRVNMEDSHSALLEFSKEHEDWHYFAVFDGHAGFIASKRSSEELHKVILEKYDEMKTNPSSISPECEREFIGMDENLPKDIYNLALAVHDGFIAFDEMMMTDPNYKAEPMGAGTTAVAAILTANYIVFANCGDSRGILCRDNRLHFFTEDHKPSNPIEKDRIISAGGTVCIDRVNGNLAVSRALGDFSFKNGKQLPLIRQAVSPEPTITVIERAPTDQFLLLACDGIWDAMTNCHVVEYILKRLQVTHDLEDICNSLVDTCLFRESKDNMTSLLITLPGVPEIDQSLVEKDRELEQRISQAVEKLMNDSDDHSDKSLSGVIRWLIQTLYNGEDQEVYNKIEYIIDLVDKVNPNRDRHKDYSSVNFRVLQTPLEYLQQQSGNYNLGNINMSESSGI